MPSLPVLLAVLFVALKLTGYIAWSWVWVLSPLWIGAILWVVIAAIALTINYFVAKQARELDFFIKRLNK